MRAANRILFLVILGMLGLLVLGMLVLSQRTPSGPEGLGALVSVLIFTGIVVGMLRAIRRARGS